MLSDCRVSSDEKSWVHSARIVSNCRERNMQLQMNDV
jgi:hypothetical protein